MFANNMMVMNLGFPDVCLEGPVPIPFPNISETEMALPTAPNILVEYTPIQTVLSWVVMSEGDIGLGVASGMCMGPTIPLMGSFTVLSEAMPTTRMTSMNLQNLSNAPGMSLVPGQFTLLLLAP
jgi:hypothetical protein